MSPDMRRPDAAPPPLQVICDVCDEPAPPGRLRDDRCVAAGRQAIAESGGKPVRTSDIIAVRRRMGE